SGQLIADVPPVDLTSTGLTVPLPPVFSNDGNSLVGGAVTAQILQLASGQVISSPQFSIGQLGAPPTSACAPGTVTLSLLQALLAQAQTEQAQLQSAGYNQETIGDLNAVIADLSGLIANIKNAMGNPSFSFSVASLSGATVSMQQKDLQA